MFSFETRINGSLISHVYGHNEGAGPGDSYSYLYRFYNVETGATFSGRVYHKRSEGLNKLITIIYKDIERITT